MVVVEPNLEFFTVSTKTMADPEKCLLQDTAKVFESAWKVLTPVTQSEKLLDLPLPELVR